MEFRSSNSHCIYATSKTLGATELHKFIAEKSWFAEVLGFSELAKLLCPPQPTTFRTHNYYTSSKKFRQIPDMLESSLPLQRCHFSSLNYSTSYKKHFLISRCGVMRGQFGSPKLKFSSIIDVVPINIAAVNFYDLRFSKSSTVKLQLSSHSN